MAQYIGETCRYLLAAAPKPEERSHKIRLMYGNGLRPQIWQEFVDRFNIKHISEFYGATEGNANISQLFSSVSFFNGFKLLKMISDYGKLVLNF